MLKLAHLVALGATAAYAKAGVLDAHLANLEQRVAAFTEKTSDPTVHGEEVYAQGDRRNREECRRGYGDCLPGLDCVDSCKDDNNPSDSFNCRCSAGGVKEGDNCHNDLDCQAPLICKVVYLPNGAPGGVTVDDRCG